MLTASLRIQTSAENKEEFGTISPERYEAQAMIMEEAHANLIIEHLQTMSSVPSSYISSASTSSISIAIPHFTHTSGREDVLVVKRRRSA